MRRGKSWTWSRLEVRFQKRILKKDHEGGASMERAQEKDAPSHSPVLEEVEEVIVMIDENEEVVSATSNILGEIDAQVVHDKKTIPQRWKKRKEDKL